MSKNAIHQDEERLARERRAVLRLYDAFSRQDPDLIDDAVTPDWEDIPPAPGQGPGPEGMKPIIRSVISAFPDVQIVVHELIQVPGKIAVRGEITGTHEGELFGIAPTGKAVRFRLHEFHALDGEHITTTWHMEDWYGLFLQLGRFPAI
ncbi:ester cyclase [Massilia sp. G4R7]|uniref:Ester cyclase n=1 Tax=Massilia phyllostachyos TaxID=2898585 RepID=A0ABS8QAS8_9BURK|nr:ester cyclase [Massilia phyllostachyos]MCD2518858.1 ester cyclase [Massilia phyllostachyos]